MSSQRDEARSLRSAEPTVAPGSRLDYIDVGIKFLGVLAVIVAAIAGGCVANGYTARVSLTSLLNQREQAGSSLRAAMLHDLIEPIIGNPTKISDVDPESHRLLVELLTLNFHEHFEFKPLLEEVARRLAEPGKESSRQSLTSAARRVADRQITMLNAIGETTGEPVQPINLFFDQAADANPTVEACGQCAEHPVTCRKDSNGSGRRNSPTDPARFRNNGGASELVCVRAPDNGHILELGILHADLRSKEVKVSVNWRRNAADRFIWWHPATWWSGTGSDVELTGYEFVITPFDFPLTDNTKIDAEQRFAVMLYDLVQRQTEAFLEGDAHIHLKVVWFPKGYITERERPLNHLELREMLGARMR